MKKKVVFGLMLVLVAVLIYIFFDTPSQKISNEEREANLTKILGRKPNLNKSEITGERIFKGKCAQFKYPAKASVYTYRDLGTKQNTSILETFSFDITSPRIVVNYVCIDREFLSNIKEIPDVVLRQNKSNGYTEENLIVEGNTGLVFTKKDISEVEKTVFFYKNKKEVTVSLTGSDLEEVNKLFNQVIADLKFIL